MLEVVVNVLGGCAEGGGDRAEGGGDCAEGGGDCSEGGFRCSRLFGQTARAVVRVNLSVDVSPGADRNPFPLPKAVDTRTECDNGLAKFAQESAGFQMTIKWKGTQIGHGWSLPGQDNYYRSKKS